MSLCQKCDPAGHIHGEEIVFLEKTRAKLVAEAQGYVNRISQMLSGELPLNRFVTVGLRECLDGIDAINNILLAVK